MHAEVQESHVGVPLASKDSSAPASCIKPQTDPFLAYEVVMEEMSTPMCLEHRLEQQLPPVKRHKIIFI